MAVGFPKNSVFLTALISPMRPRSKARRRSPAVRPRDRNGGFPRLSGRVARASRCPASPRHALLAENLGKPSLGVNIMDLWYYVPSTNAGDGSPADILGCRPPQFYIGPLSPSSPIIRDRRAPYCREISARLFWGSRTPSSVGTSGSLSPRPYTPRNALPTPSR